MNERLDRLHQTYQEEVGILKMEYERMVERIQTMREQLSKEFTNIPQHFVQLENAILETQQFAQKVEVNMKRYEADVLTMGDKVTAIEEKNPNK